ncbi:unnamed protein product [Mytilus coruscus]|uniref:Uncharacterized protein n=1 Tax=Mytilus coruscus TaxID=42192 RepID=A0A6J8DD56_MYTCO|nr:unnamed protein product [Mytilus coruscus]
MATDSSDYQLEDEIVQELFSKQFIGDMSRKIVGIHDVVQKFIETNTMSDDEKKALLEKKVVDTKFNKLIKVVTKHCDKNNLQVLKSFICALEETKNNELAKQLTLVYDERVNSLSILNRLAKEKSLVGNLKGEIKRLQLTLEKRDELQRKQPHSGEIQRLKENFVHVIGEEKEQLSKEIEKLEDRIAEKESTILNLRKNQTLTRGEIEEELKKITSGHEKKIDEQIAVIQNQNENICQQNEKIDVLTNTVMKLVNLMEKKQ